MRFQPSVHTPHTYGAATVMTPTLRQGATDATTGNSVSRVINALVRNGYPVAGLTGPIAPGRATYGAKVAAAVKKLQQELDISPADGIVGPKTWEAIRVLEATAGATVTGGGATIGSGGVMPTIPPSVTPILPSGGTTTTTTPEVITLPDGTTVSEAEASWWQKFRASKAFWPAVGGTVIAGGIFAAVLIRTMRRSS